MKFFRLLCFSACFALVGCQVTPPRIDPYSGLLAANTRPTSSSMKPAKADLSAQTVYVVVGANYVTYADAWNKMTERGRNPLAYMLVPGGKDLLEFAAASWSPERTNSIVIDMLKKHFKEVRVVDDFGAARKLGASWIVMYDHAYVQTSTATASWTNVTTIDLLTRDLQKAIGVEVTESSAYGAAWGPDDSHRFSKLRGEDIVKTITAASRQFDQKLTAIAQ